MRANSVSRERTAWLAVVAALASALVWLGVVVAAMALRLHGADLSQALAVGLTVGRALARTALVLVGNGLPLLVAMLAAAVVAGMLLRLPQPGALEKRSVRHG